MKFPTIRKETGVPLLGLLFSSLLCVALVGLKIFWTSRFSNLYLIWNLFLAWLPLLFSLMVVDYVHRGKARGWRFYAAAFAWLIFFPNAPYILTDLIHLRATQHHHYWVEMFFILLFAWTGFLLGFMSLYLMHTVVARLAGRAIGWLFVVLVTGLSGLGIYLGRFLRWNSWDLFVNPSGVLHDIGRMALNPFSNSGSVGLSALFAVFTLSAYLMLHALTHLQPGREKMLAEAGKNAAG